jgi:hypothetical protein
MSSDSAGRNDRFFRYFQHEITALQEQIDGLKNTSLVGGERNDAVDHCLAGIARLSQEVKDASSYLPTYDQRTYAEAVKALTEKLTTVRNSFGPRPKFTFKSALKRRSLNGTPPHFSNALAAGPASSSESPSNTSSNSSSRDEPADPAIHEINRLIRESKDKSTIHRPTFETTNAVALESQKHVYVAVAPPSRGRAGGRAAKMTEISDSVVDLQETATIDDPFAGVVIRDVQNSVVVCGNVSGPVHITNVTNSVLVMTCRQFRMHDSTNVKVYLHCSSKPIIEDCKGIQFAPLPKGAAVESSDNRWNEVDDFKWLKAEQSPNWSLIDQKDRFDASVWHSLSFSEASKAEATSSALQAFGVEQ